MVEPRTAPAAFLRFPGWPAEGFPKCSPVSGGFETRVAGKVVAGAARRTWPARPLPPDGVRPCWPGADQGGGHRRRGGVGCPGRGSREMAVRAAGGGRGRGGCGSLRGVGVAGALAATGRCFRSPRCWPLIKGAHASDRAEAARLDWGRGRRWRGLRREVLGGETGELDWIGGRDGFGRGGSRSGLKRWGRLNWIGFAGGFGRVGSGGWVPVALEVAGSAELDRRSAPVGFGRAAPVALEAVGPG